MSRTKVKNSVLGPEFFGTVVALTPAATINVDFDSASTFTVTPSDNTTTFNIQNAEAGMVKNIVLTGDGTARTLAFTANGGSPGGTFNKIGATLMDETASGKSMLQIVCVNATAGSQEFWYSISKPQTV
tara:strand:+ start:115 stop:501 length:387 start_codon:yes stop_codon:yes gene_type:complete